MWVFAMMAAVPLIEIGLFITIGGWLTLWPTLAIVVLTAVLGALLIHRQGRQAMADIRGSMQRGDPLMPLAHGGLILLAGIFLMTPGFFTDTLGLLLLIPPLRRWLIAILAQRIKMNMVVMGQSRHPARDDVIDADYTNLNDPQPPGNSGWTRH